MCDIDVFVGNFTIVDWEIHRLWVDGYNVGEAIFHLKKHIYRDLSEYTYCGANGTPDELLASEVNDHFRVLAMFENSILSHVASKSNKEALHHFQFINTETVNRLIESYYSLDDSLCREILGKKFNSRLRKDLDEICEMNSSPIRLRSARRQFDNVKRVFKTMEDMTGDYVTNIQSQFGLSQKLAEKYATLVFLTSHRFEVSKKKLNYLQFDDFVAMSLKMMEGWMDFGKSGDDGVGGEEPSLDKDFLSSLRDLKVIQDRDKEHRNVVCLKLRRIQNEKGSSRLSTASVYNEIESNFKTLTRGIISVATSLSQNKLIKDFFILVVEKIAEPLGSMRILKNDVEVLLMAYTTSITELTTGEVMLVDNEVRLKFAKFMRILSPIVMVAYRKSG